MGDVNEGKVLVVTVEERDVYGKLLFYPKNDVAEIMCQIAKKKTLTFRDLNLLDTSMNFAVKYHCNHGTQRHDTT